MRLWNHLIHLCLFIIIHSLEITAQEMFPVGNFEKLRRGNCTTCSVRPRVPGSHLPRLSLIKQRILQALGRGREKEPQQKYIAPTYLPKAFIAPKHTTTTPIPAESESVEDEQTINEIITFSETIGSDNGNAIIKFTHHNNRHDSDVEPIGASLLLYINRRRKIKKGGRGKKIMLTVTDHDERANSDEILTYLRTRVKRRRWKKLSLPLSVAQKFLDSGERGLSLKVNCLGCGRLVQLVFYSSTDARKSKKGKRKRHGDRTNKQVGSSVRKSKKKARRKQTMSARPILVISTRTRRDS